MNNTISALTARTQLGQILKRAAENNERFQVGRRGEPTVIIMGVRDYIKTIAPTPPSFAALRNEAKRKNVGKLTMRDIDREIAVVRRQHQKKTSKHTSR